MKILTVLGARPQFIKAATVSRVLKSVDGIQETILHTGQHFDQNMSEVFFEELDIPKPNYNLEISGLAHGSMTGRMLEAIEGIIEKEKPQCVMVYGDTNSTLAGALAAVKLQIDVAHVEAGLRSGNISMPEEINRALTDRISSLLLCPTETALNNLCKEGYPFNYQRIENVGDVMFDAALFYKHRAKKEIDLNTFKVEKKSYALCTLHRQENTDNPKRLLEILKALRVISLEIPIVLPLHPRTKDKIQKMENKNLLEGLMVISPVSYLEMQCLEINAKMIFTDSGGMQKEAYFHDVPCITLRDETEWTETVTSGWNSLAGHNKDSIIEKYKTIKVPEGKKEMHYGRGKAAEHIVNTIANTL